MSQNFEGLYPRPEPIPFELPMALEGVDSVITPENSLVERYWDQPNECRITINNPKAFTGMVLRGKKHLPLADLLLSEEFYSQQGWRPDLVFATKADRPNDLTPFTYVDDSRHEVFHAVDPKRVSVV